jgi:hypothetical protein
MFFVADRISIIQNAPFEKLIADLSDSVVMMACSMGSFVNLSVTVPVMTPE